MKKVSILLALLTLVVCQAVAVAFTENRYDSFRTLKINEQSIVFMGNSITNSHEWTEAFGRDPRVVCRGVGSAQTSDGLKNIENVIMGHPAKLFLMLGVNDVFKSIPLETAFENTKTIVERFERESPNTEIYIESVLPTCGTNYAWACANVEKLNAMYKAFVEEKNSPKLKYIDIHSLLLDNATGQMVTKYACDGCHLYPNAYQIWCNAVAPYVGIPTIYPKVEEGLLEPFSVAGYSGTHLARVCFFNFLPIPDESVLIFGDSFIESGEWAEFFHSNKVLNRGSGMGYNDLDLSQLNQSAPYIFHDKPCPKQIWICPGNKPAVNSQAASTFQTQLNTLISTIRSSLKNNGQDTRIVLCSCLPSNNSSQNTNYITKYNEVLKNKADGDSNIDYVDLYTPLVNGNVANTRYFQDERLGARGYAKMAKTMESKIKEAIPEAYVLSETESDANYDLFNTRTTLAKNVEAISAINCGTDAGQFAEADCQKVQALVTEGSALLQRDATLMELQMYSEKVAAALEEIKPNVGRPKTNDGDGDHWYTLSTPQRGGYYASCAGEGEVLCGAEKGESAAQQWKFEERIDGTYNIINRKYGCFVVPNHTHGSSLTTSVTEPSEGWTIDLSESLGLFIIHSGNYCQFNQTTNAGTPIYNWFGNGNNAMNKLDEGCQYRIYPAEEPEDMKSVSDVKDLADGFYLVSSTQAGLENRLVGATSNPLVSGEKTYNVALLTSVAACNAPQAFVSVKKTTGGYDVRVASGAGVTNPAVIASGTNGLTVQNWGTYTADSKKYYVTEVSGKNDTWKFMPANTDFYDYYEVSVSGEGAESAQITCTNSALMSVKKVGDKGFYFFPKGTKVSSSDFTAPEVGGMKASFRVNASIHSVMCTYTSGDASDVQKAYDALSEAVDKAATQAYDESLVGPDPGYYSEEGIAALKAAIVEAQEALKQSLTAEEYNALTEKVNAAIKAATINGIENGFYQIVCADPRFEQSQGVQKAWYFWNQTGWTCWVNYRERDDRQMFYIEELPTEGQYSIQDVTHTKWYLGSGAKSTQNQTVAQTFTSFGNGQWIIRNTVDAAAYHCLSHSSGAGQYGNLTMWENAAFDFGRWYLRRVVDPDYLHHLEGFRNGGYDLVRSMMSTLEKAAEAYDQATGTTQGNGLVTKASYGADSQLWTNMPQNRYGSIDYLIDGKNSTWLMMVPDGTNRDVPYVGVDLSANPVKDFYFKTATITQSSGSGHPTELHLMASDDKAQWKEVARYTTELPTATNKEFLTKVMLDKAYKYLRFDFYESHNYTTTNQYNIPSTSPNISLGQLQVYPIASATASDADVQTAAAALNEQMGKAWTLVRSENVTQDDIDALKGAMTALNEALNPGSHAYDVELVNAPSTSTVITVKGKTYGNGATVRSDAEITAADVKADEPGYTAEVTVKNGVIRVVYSIYSAPLNLDGKTVKGLGEKTTSVVKDQWYMLTQNREGETPTVDNGVGKVITREMSKTSEQVFVKGLAATDVAKYLVRFTDSPLQNAYRMQFGTGNFFATEGNAAPAKKVAVVSDPDHAYNVLVSTALNKTPNYPEEEGIVITSTDDGSTYGFILDNGNKSVSRALNFWADGQITEGVNNVWYIYPVEFNDVDEEQIARNKALLELINTAQSTYDKNNGAQIGDNLITEASQFSSPYSDSAEGKSFDALLDLSGTTFWHSDWHNKAPEGAHYLQVDLKQPFSGDIQVTFMRRSTDNDHVSLLGVQYSTDGNTFNDYEEVSLPFGARGETVTGHWSQMDEAVAFRFFANATVNYDGADANRGFWHVADFQLNELISATPLNDEHPTEAAALVEALAAAKAVENASDADIAALQTAYDAYIKACQEKPDGVGQLSTTNSKLSTIYNLQGQRMSTLTRGVNIVNGHKIVK